MDGDSIDELPLSLAGLQLQEGQYSRYYSYMVESFL
jgi:hypothetical protein